MPRPMPSRGKNRMPEKSHDFKGSMIRLFNSLNKWKYLLLVSLGLAMISAVLAIISPNILSDLTDTITEGVKPNTEALKVISEKVSSSFTFDNINGKMKDLVNNDNITSEDKLLITNVFLELQYSDDPSSYINSFVKLPASALSALFDDMEYDGQKISALDQAKFVQIMSSVDNSSDTNKMLDKIDELPSSIYKVIEPDINMDNVKSIAIFLGTIYLISAIFSYIQSFSMTTVSNNFAKRLRTSISEKINKLPLKYFDTHETGNVLSIVTNDVDMIGMQMNQSLSTLVTSITLFLGSVIMMFVTDYRMAFTAIISSLVGFLAMGLILGKSQKYFNQRQIELGNMNGYIEEMYSGANVVKTYNGTKKAISDFDELNEKLYICNRKSSFLSGLMQPIMGFVGNFGYVAVCVVGALLTMNGYITFGVIVAFMIYVRLFTNPLSQIAQAMTNLQSTAAAAERVFEFLDEKELADESEFTDVLSKDTVKGNIEFKNVKFGYDEDKIIINDFSAKANSGQKIAIVGPTGAGKTTMVNLLMKFYELTDGDILIDGVSTKKLTRENIHELFIMVLQDTWLFEGTVRENIKFNKKDVTDEEIWEALKTVGVNHFVKTLPGGLDAKLTDADSISQGQKQLLTIARGMIEDAPFLILDEATSNVDTRTEELVQKAMDKLTVGRTSFIIAHRLSTIKNADIILVMKNGNIIEMGNHDELIKKNGFYADLYNSQFKK